MEQQNTTIEYDFTDVPDQGELLEEGFYHLIIKSTSIKKIKESEKQYLSVEYQEKESGITVFDNIMIGQGHSNQILSRSKELFKNISYIRNRSFDKLKLKAQIDINTLKDLEVFSKVEIETYQNIDRNAIPFNGYYLGNEKYKELTAKANQSQSNQSGGQASADPF